MPKRFTVPGPDEIAARVPLDRLPVLGQLVPRLPGLTGGRPGKIPVGIPVKVPVRLPPWLFRDIAYFAYAAPDLLPVDGETTTQEDIFRVSAWSGVVRRVTDDRTSPVFRWKHRSTSHGSPWAKACQSRRNRQSRTGGTAMRIFNGLTLGASLLAAA